MPAQIGRINTLWNATVAAATALATVYITTATITTADIGALTADSISVTSVTGFTAAQTDTIVDLGNEDSSAIFQLPGEKACPASADACRPNEFFPCKDSSTHYLYICGRTGVGMRVTVATY